MRDTWSKQLVVTVSVEPDDPSVVGRMGAYRSVDGLGRFHELCRRHGVRPTYLLTYSAASEPRCAELARSWAQEAELGAHLHPEEVPPIAENERDNPTLRPSDVEPQRLRAKLGNLVERIAEATGRTPTSYRSGFFDLTPAQVAALLELGIEVDSSLGPLEKVGRCYPFLRAPFAPYVVDPDDVCRPLGSDFRSAISDCRLADQETEKSQIANRKSQIPRLVEVPMTSVFRRPFPRAFHRAYFGLPGRVRGLLRAVGLADVVRFRPATASERDLATVCRRAERLGIPAVMTIHSNELWPGTSATVPTEAACAGYFERLERVFAYARERDWTSRTLTEVARVARRDAA